MTLAAGTHLGPYEIGPLIGAGGMGEVYRAHDHRLARDVAVKVIRHAMAESGTRRERFEREARVLAALSHPNIVAMHDVGCADGQIYAVMELLQGETLRARLARGPLPWRRAVAIAAAVADGLGAAHARGIVHRDLKPANVFVTADGRVKVLDFGLARLDDPATSELSSSVTASQPASGGVSGTCGYMSPEQVSGGTIDFRTDLFALGCVLHEMVGGRRTFARATPAETMAAVLDLEAAELANVPFELGRVITRCLEKDPDARFQSARDLAFHLRALLEPAAGRLSGKPQYRHRIRRRKAWLVAGGAAAAVVVFASSFENATRPPPAVQSHLMIPEGLVLSADAEPSFVAGPIAISPDGQQVVYSASADDGTPWLWGRRFDALMPRRLDDTAGARGPFWSPDGRFIAFLADGQLKRIAASGGPAQILDGSGPFRWYAGGTWSAAGDIVIGHDSRLPLLRLASSGGPPVPTTRMDQSRRDIRHCCPDFLPDGRHFLYFVITPLPEDTGIYVGSLDSSASTFIVRSTGRGAFAPPNHLIFERGDTLLAAPFDPARLTLTGEPTPLANGVKAFSVSSIGALVYWRWPGNHRLVWIDRSGNEIEELAVSSEPLLYRRLSHDGRRIAAAVEDRQTGVTAIWVFDLERPPHAVRLTHEPASAQSPVWSPDDERIVYASSRNGRFDIYEKASNGLGAETLLYQSDVSKGIASWSRDARLLIFNTEGVPDGEMWSLVLPDRKPSLLFREPFQVWDGQISPDGRWIAYVGSESAGSRDVYVRAAQSGPRWRLSTSGGLWPKWRSDGQELFFIDPGTRALMVVDVPASGDFADAVPRVLFTVRPSHMAGWYNSSPDGQRFLFARNSRENGVADALVLVQNWPALLKK
jgi:eukaryotic-like serine/threonine-protein kinase